MWNVVYGVVWCVWGVVWTRRGVTTRGVTTWYANSGMEHSVTTWCGVCVVCRVVCSVMCVVWNAVV